MQLRYLAKAYHQLAPGLTYLPLAWQVKFASWARSYFMQQFYQQTPRVPAYQPPPNQRCNLWGLTFQGYLGNAAGMFKNGEGYSLAASLGAGAYVGGTTTVNPRRGNFKHGIGLPFLNLATAHSTLNWLGLPNIGDQQIICRLSKLSKIPGCPLGWSLMRSPDLNEGEGMQQLIASLWRYHDLTPVDFIEINESCPNIQAGGGSMVPRLELIAAQFLAKRRRRLPVVVKLSNDISPQALAALLASLVRLGFDGINLGNTATDYAQLRQFLPAREQVGFDYFTTRFGGGVSGQLLTSRSLLLCATAAEELERLQPEHEFHIIRCGGVASSADLQASRQHGVSFNQWYTGFFEQYLAYGAEVYRRLFSSFQKIYP